MGIYLNDWEGQGFITVVGAFEDIYLTDAEYLSEASPYSNSEYWLDKKEAMAAALSSDKYKGVEVLLASYGGGSYEGDAFVLFRRDGKLYEVHGSHCSCYGLEGQWEPEETFKEALMKRMDEGQLGSHDWGDNAFANELREVLSSLPDD